MSIGVGHDCVAPNSRREITGFGTAQPCPTDGERTTANGERR